MADAHSAQGDEAAVPTMLSTHGAYVPEPMPSTSKLAQGTANPALQSTYDEGTKVANICKHTDRPSPQQLLEDLAKVAAGRHNLVDTYGNGEGLQAFEAEVAAECGMEQGLFFATGTAANRAATRALLDVMTQEWSAEAAAAGFDTSKDGLNGSNRLYVERYSQRQISERFSSVSVHYTSHLVHLDCLGDGAEQRDNFMDLAKSNCAGVNIIPYGRMDTAASYSCVARVLNDASNPNPGVVVVELPQRMNGGATMKLEDLRAVRALTTKLGVSLHMDGARLWDVQPYYGISLKEICSLFDTVYVSFYKGLGSMGGAMLMGKKTVIDQARVWRKRFGGVLHTFYPMWLDCERKFNEVYKPQPGQPQAMAFQARADRLRSIAFMLHERIIDTTASKEVMKIVPEVPMSCMVHVYIRGLREDLDTAYHKTAMVSGVCLWDRLRGPGFGAKLMDGGSAPWHYFEWTMGTANMDHTDEKIVQAFAEFLDILHRLQEQRKELASAGKEKKTSVTKPVAEVPPELIPGAPLWWHTNELPPPIAQHVAVIGGGSPKQGSPPGKPRRSSPAVGRR